MLDSKGLIVDEEDWLLTPAFARIEAKTESDGKHRDSNGRHYLKEMDYQCQFCHALGFESEAQGGVADPNTPTVRKLVHFGALCCNRGKVKGISDYAPPHDLEILYTSNDQVAVNFCNDARTYNNAMAMCSVIAKRGWRSRAHDNKTDSMLTASGQLLRRAGPLIPGDGEQPKCVQTYFYGGDEVTKWRMMNMKKKISAKDRNNYVTVFKKLHTVLMEVDNKYIKSFLGVKDYIETHLKDKVWDIKLSIHANDPPSALKHKGRLNVPTVNGIAILLPISDIITKHHKRQVKSCVFF